MGVDMFSFEFIINNFAFIISAIPVTLEITALSLVFACVLGGLYAWVFIKNIRGLNWIVQILVSFGRSIPVLVLLYFVFYVYPYVKVALFHEPMHAIATSKFTPSSAAVISLTIVFSSYFAEVFRSAYSAVDKGQLEAAVSVGMSGFASFRRIILPQATLSGLPNYTNVLIDLLKDTSLVYSITVLDVMAKANIAASRGFHFVEAYVLVLFIYIVLCFVLAKSLQFLEIRMGNRWHQPVNRIGS